MKKLILSFAFSALAYLSVSAQDKLTLQLKWVPQAQFMGYYVAKEKGFYKDEKLDVVIKPAGPDTSPMQVLAGGGADVIVNWLGDALAAREKGVQLVNIAQIFKRSGMMLTCRKDSKIQTPKDFAGKTLGVWYAGNEYPFLSWMAKLNLATTGGKNGVTVLKQGFNVDPLLQKQADCISTMTYNEYQQVLEAGVKESDLITFKYEDQGVSILEDGLYTLDKNLQDKAMADKLARFVRASIKGWEYAKNNQKEAVAIVLKNDDTGSQTEQHQTTMAFEVAKLLSPSKLGYLEPADFDRSVKVLLSSNSTPVITKKPTGAWSHQIYNQAVKK